MNNKIALRVLFYLTSTIMILVLLVFFGSLYRFAQGNERAQHIYNVYAIMQAIPSATSLLTIIYILIGIKDKDVEIKSILITFLVFIFICLITTLVLLIWKNAL